jgi:peptidoglycan/xylan/chitin deacetylase (PgdA/CDA1 family)
MLRAFIVAVGVLLGLTAHQALAAKPGPPVVAKANRHLWPDPINTPASFDRASRAALRVHASVFSEMKAMSDADLIATLRVAHLERASVDQWLNRTLAATQRSYQLAARDCAPVGNDWTCLPGTEIPEDLQPWKADTEQFSRAYLLEQLKLAAVFARDNSEIDTFNDNEWNGERLPDRHFYLSFDDGPTAPHGNTDATVQMLNDAHKSAVFFVLGSNFKVRKDKTDVQALNTLYGRQCVASHGWEHHSHARWEPWQDSVRLTQALIDGSINTPNALKLFRPPYGQRRPDSEAFFRAQSLQVALWNIDSLDWNSHMTAAEAADRVIALMLIKRHGVLLFHDIHSKARIALPAIFEETGSAVEWGDCHQIGPPWGQDVPVSVKAP